MKEHGESQPSIFSQSEMMLILGLGYTQTVQPVHKKIKSFVFKPVKETSERSNFLQGPAELDLDQLLEIPRRLEGPYTPMSNQGSTGLNNFDKQSTRRNSKPEILKLYSVPPENLNPNQLFVYIPT